MKNYMEMSTDELYEEIERLITASGDWLTYLSEMVPLTPKENAELGEFIAELNHALGR